MSSIINADTSDGLKFTSDTSGEIKLQSAGTDIVSVTANGMAVDTNTLYVDATNNYVGVGTSSPTTTLDVETTVRSKANAASNDSTVGKVSFYNTNASASANPERAYIEAGRENSAWGAYLKFATSTGTSAASEKMRIASNGYVGFDVTSPTYRIHLNGGSPTAANSGIAAAWNLHSDYRLKENVSNISNASNVIKNLRPVNFSWVEDNSNIPTTQGFIAHELQEQAPFSVLGEKDAVDEENNPMYQAADYSKLVPLLTAALQEAITKIEDLETRIQALENA